MTERRVKMSFICTGNSARSDYVISVCARAAETCPTWPRSRERIRWHFDAAGRPLPRKIGCAYSGECATRSSSVCR